MVQWVLLLCALSLVSSLQAKAFLVNTYTVHAQRSESIAFGGDGTVTIVWRDAETATSGQYFNRFDSAGLPVGTTTLVTSDSTSHPEVSAASDGSFAIVWEERESQPGPDDKEILAHRYDNLGMPVGTTIHVNTSTEDGQRYPVIAHDSAGNFVVAWHIFLGNPATTVAILGQRYDSAGSTLGGEFQISTTGAGSFEHSAAISVLPNDSFVVVWYGDLDDLEDPDGRNVMAQMFDSTGAPIGGEFRVNTALDGRQGGKVDVASDALGNFTVVYTSNTRTPPSVDLDDVVAQRFDSTGTALGTEFQVNKVRNATDPRIAMQDSGNFLVSYRAKDFDGNGVAGKYFDSDGTPVGEEFPLSARGGGDQEIGRIATNGTDQFVAVWTSDCNNSHRKCDEDEDGDREGVFARRWVTTPPTCPTAPQPDCLEAGKSSITLTDTGGGKLLWKWGGGPAFDVGHVGSPANDLTDYVMCLYREDGGAPSLVMSAAVPGGGTCGGKPCWRANNKGSKTKYKNVAGTPDGVDKVRFKTGEAGRSRFLVKGKGANLSVPLPIGSFTEVTAQMITGHGACWQAAFDSAAANSAAAFRARF